MQTKFIDFEVFLSMASKIEEIKATVEQIKSNVAKGGMTVDSVRLEHWKEDGKVRIAVCAKTTRYDGARIL